MNAMTDIPGQQRFDASNMRGPSAMSVQWAALQDAGAAVAALAGLAEERTTAQIRNYPALIRDLGGWRLELATQGVADLSAVMQPGLKALLATSARGQDPTAAALRLWSEFREARAALLDLAPDTGTMGPLRKA